jgi:hypothetical protein
MTLTRKDGAATALTALAVLVFLATHESWTVPLVGDSHRWAGAVILLLGSMTCEFGSRTAGSPMRTMGILGTLALVLGVLAIATGSLTPLSLLVVDLVLMWAIATTRHARHPGAAVPA